MEKRTARLTVLVDPQKKAAFEKLCELEDVTPSQKIRQFMRDYIEQALGADDKEQIFNGENDNN
ncbi:CopG family transcriptional regulator [Nitrincola sp. MINF-07-Sa-05]|uniref:CopG family transcriptional regulator n=1 Tax=Nitrincola salilacus TaxID=3400273 RepID=UPI003917BF3B